MIDDDETDERLVNSGIIDNLESNDIKIEDVMSELKSRKK